MATASQIRKTAEQKVKEQSTETIIATFEYSETQPCSEELAIVRGWLMDELESRNPGAFNSWMESNELSPRSFYL